MPKDNLVVNLTYWNQENGKSLSYGGHLESLSADEIAKKVVEEFRQNGDEEVLSKIYFCSPFTKVNGKLMFSKETKMRPLTFKEFEILQDRLTEYSKDL